jgi:hypothetical protein
MEGSEIQILEGLNGTGGGVSPFGLRAIFDGVPVNVEPMNDAPLGAASSSPNPLLMLLVGVALGAFVVAPLIRGEKLFSR